MRCKKPIIKLIALLTFLLLRPLNAAPPAGFINAGVGCVDITPTEPVMLAGSPSRLKSTSVSSRLYARALVLSDGKQKIAIVTLDTLKYPVEHSERARQQIEKTSGIPAANVIICSSHTHNPLERLAKSRMFRSANRCGFHRTGRSSSVANSLPGLPGLPGSTGPADVSET